VVETELKSIINEVSFETFSAHYPHYSEPTYFSKCMQTCLDHLRDAFASSANINEALKLFLGQDSIPLMTVHKSKGLEFEVVFFIGFEDETLSRAKEHVNFSFSRRRLNNFNKIDTRSINHITPIFAALAKSNLVSEEDRRVPEE
jgi:ATP-dependent exoDNAse (exonuclease V) beta subunit